MRMRRMMMAASVADPYWDDVVALLHFDGTDGSTTFTDEKGHTFTASGGAQIDDAQSKFWQSGKFDGSGDYISTPSDSDWTIDTDCTIELFIRSSGMSKTRTLISRREHYGSSPASGWHLVTTSTKTVSLTQYLSGGGVGVSIEGGALSLNTWHHIAVTNDSGNWRLFVDGVQVDSDTETGTNGDNSRPLYIGRQEGTSARDFEGWIDELRITKGVARYTSNFAPPSAPFPNS